jgi:hypothetical protein
MNEPMTGERIKPGMAEIDTTRPALAAEPVRSRANQGSEIKTIDMLITLAIEAIWVKTKGLSDRTSPSIRGAILPVVVGLDNFYLRGSFAQPAALDQPEVF